MTTTTEQSAPRQKMDISLFDAPVSWWDADIDQSNTLVAEAVARGDDPRVRDAFGWTPLLKSALNAPDIGLVPFALLVPFYNEEELLFSIPVFRREEDKSTAALVFLASGKIVSKEASNLCERIWNKNKSAAFSAALKLTVRPESVDPRSLFEVCLRGGKGHFSLGEPYLKLFLDASAKILSETPEYAPLVAAVLSKRVEKAFEDKYLGDDIIESGEKLKGIVAGAMAAQVENEEPETGPAL